MPSSITCAPVITDCVISCSECRVSAGSEQNPSSELNAVEHNIAQQVLPRLHLALLLKAAGMMPPDSGFSLPSGSVNAPPYLPATLTTLVIILSVMKPAAVSIIRSCLLAVMPHWQASAAGQVQTSGRTGRLPRRLPSARRLTPQGLNNGIVPHQSPTLERLMLQLTPGENRDDS